MNILKSADEQDLWVRFKEHDDSAAREELVIRYMRVVRYIAGRVAINVPANVDMDDLVGWGMLGLMDAADKFDHAQNIKFSTYAAIRIRGAIIDEIRSLDWAPRSLRTMARKVASARDKLRHEKGAEPSSSEIADMMGTTQTHVEDTLAQLQTVQMISLDDYLPAEEAEEARRLNMISSKTTPTPDQAAIEKEKLEKLVEAILVLPEQQQKVLNLYYFEELTLKEIGVVLEVSESRICQIHSAAMKTLRKYAQRGG